MSPELLRKYLEVLYDFSLSVSGVALAAYLLSQGQDASNVAGSVAAIMVTVQSVRKNTAMSDSSKSPPLP